jgi:dihydroxyacetone kinase
VVETAPIRVLPAPAATRGAPAPASGDAATEAVIRAVCTTLIALEDELNRLDARAGDGDTGTTVTTGARAVEAKLQKLPLADTAATFEAIGETLGQAMGGSSGVLMSIFFTASAKAMRENGDVTAALLAGLDRMTFYGGATLGARTLVDSLDPALRALSQEGLVAAAAAAQHGAEGTKTMTRARAGRAAYVGARDLEGSPDPGAVAVARVFEAMARLA